MPRKKKPAAPPKRRKEKAGAAPSTPSPSTRGGGPAADAFPAILEPGATAIRAKIVLRKEDVLRDNVDAVVIPANTDLILAAGIAQAARRRGGEVIQKECKRMGSVPLGQAVVTTAGKLRCRHLIHAACVGLGQKTTEKELMDSMLNALKRGVEKGCKTIAFPVMGVTHDDFPVKRCAEIMISEVQKHLDAGSPYEAIHFCVPDPLEHRAFESLLKELQE